jgi:hypothetical protein
MVKKRTRKGRNSAGLYVAMIWLVVTVPFAALSIWMWTDIRQQQRALESVEFSSGHVVKVHGCTRRGSGCVYTVRYPTASGPAEFQWQQFGDIAWEDKFDNRVTVGRRKILTGYDDLFIVTSPYGRGRLPGLLIGLAGCSFSLFILGFVFWPSPKKSRNQKPSDS